MSSNEPDINVATAHGPGAGQFLAAALLDALESDMPLVDVRESLRPPPDATRGVDFVFARDRDRSEEVIRVGLGPDGQVITAQIVRRIVGALTGGFWAKDALLAALHAGDSVTALNWLPATIETDGWALEITMRSHRQFEIATEGDRSQR